MAVKGHDIVVALVKNGQNMMLAYSSTAAWETGAISVALALKKGDKVWIRRQSHGRYVNRDYNVFSGYLISRKM